MGDVVAVYGSCRYVATWKMFDGETSRTYRITVTKDVCKKGRIRKNKKKLHQNGRILSEFLPTICKKICTYFLGGARFLIEKLEFLFKKMADGGMGAYQKTESNGPFED